MPKSDAAGGIRSGRRFAGSSNIVGRLEPRGHREGLVRELLLDVRLAQLSPVGREIIDVICDHGKTIVAAIVGINQSIGQNAHVLRAPALGPAVACAGHRRRGNVTSSPGRTTSQAKER